jgi:DNA polymerase III subunit delta'
MSWESVIGQQRVKKLLQSAIEREHLAHALLFFGPEGAGQDAVALELAKVLNCASHASVACDHCPDCLKNAEMQHPNVQLIFPLPVGKNEEAGDLPMAKLSPTELELVREQLRLKTANPYHAIVILKATLIKVNSIRDIRRSASMSAFSEGKKVYIISSADKMNDEAANALLKTLEEPLHDTVIILTTANPDQLLPTIVSRCQRIRFDKLSEADIRDGLVSRFNLDPEKAELLAEVAAGSYTRAVELIDADLSVYRDEIVDFLRTMLYRSREEFLKAIEEMTVGADRKEIERSLVLLQAWFHDALIAREGVHVRKHLTENTTLRKFIEVHPYADYGKVHEILSEAISSVNKNVYIPLILTVLAFKLRTNILSRSAR